MYYLGIGRVFKKRDICFLFLVFSFRVPRVFQNGSYPNSKRVMCVLLFSQINNKLQQFMNFGEHFVHFLREYKHR